MLSIRAKSFRKMGERRGKTGAPFPSRLLSLRTSKFENFCSVPVAGLGLFTEKFGNKAETKEYFVPKSSY
jgi:hypothetical protein